MAEEIKTQIEVKLDHRTHNKDGTLRKKRLVKYDALFSVRVASELLAKIKSIDDWQDWSRNVLEREINLRLDKAKEI